MALCFEEGWGKDSLFDILQVCDIDGNGKDLMAEEIFAENMG